MYAPSLISSKDTVEVEMTWSFEELKSAEEQLAHFVEGGILDEAILDGRRGEFVARLYALWQRNVRSQGELSHSIKNLARWAMEMSELQSSIPSLQHKLKGRLGVTRDEVRILLLVFLTYWSEESKGVQVSFLGLSGAKLAVTASTLTDQLMDKDKTLLLSKERDLTKERGSIYMLATQNSPQLWSDIVNAISSHSPISLLVRDRLGFLEGELTIVPIQIIPCEEKAQSVYVVGTTKVPNKDQRVLLQFTF